LSSPTPIGDPQRVSTQNHKKSFPSPSINPQSFLSPNCIRFLMQIFKQLVVFGFPYQNELFSFSNPTFPFFRFCFYCSPKITVKNVNEPAIRLISEFGLGWIPPSFCQAHPAFWRKSLCIPWFRCRGCPMH
jgi:hypothetical protein